MNRLAHIFILDFNSFGELFSYSEHRTAPLPIGFVVLVIEQNRNVRIGQNVEIFLR